MSTRSDTLIARVDRADTHLRSFCDELNAVYQSNPFEVSVKPNPDGGYPIYYASRVDPIPRSLKCIGGDIVHNLRSALDNTAYQLALDGNGGITRKMAIAASLQVCLLRSLSIYRDYQA